MPRWRQRVPRQKKVKVPRPAKLKRPKVRDLRMVLKGLLTVSVENRLAALAYALQWYDTALPYLIQKGQLTPDAKKKLEIAVKCRKQAIGTTNPEEKETAQLMAIRAYEKVCIALKPALVDKYYDLFKAKKSGLEHKQTRLAQKFGAVVGLLQKAIGDRVKLNVADAQKAIQYDPKLVSLSYNRDAAKQMALQFRAEGILPVFIDQLETLSMHAALEPDGQGGYQFDPAKQVQMQDELLKAFVLFAKSSDAPKKLVKNGVVVQRQPKAPCVACQGTGKLADGTVCQQCAQAPRPPRMSVKGPRVLGFLVPGTAICTVYERLKDELEHDMAEVIAGLVTADPVGRVKQLGRYGQQKGCMTVTISGNKVQLKHTQGVQP